MREVKEAKLNYKKKQMNKQEKITEIRRAFNEGRLKRLANGCYSAPSSFFIEGITPTLIKEVLG